MAKGRIPMIRTGLALQSLRDSGYSLAAALGEPIDNSIEAEANNIAVRLDEGTSRAGKKHIHRIVIADDGRGMDEDTLHHYLVLGFSTRYMRTDTIGKYGVGAKLAALNFGRQIDVWSRTSKKEPWRHVVFDLDRAIADEEKGQDVGVEPPTEESVPEDIATMLPDKSGTVVIWSKVERLEEGRFAEDANTLRVEIEKELSRIFRYFMEGGIHISVNGQLLLPHDPLFVMEKTWADKILGDHFKPTRVIYRHKISVAGSEALCTITVYPKQVVRERGKGGDDLARKLRVPENQGSISFVRLNREISYTNVPRIFPRGVEEPDRFIGIEVSFKPELDSQFGVRNVKRGVEPHGELRVQLRKVLEQRLPEARSVIDEIWGESGRKSKKEKGEHVEIEDAVREANRTLPKGRAKGPESPEERERVLTDLAADLGIQDEKERQAFIERIKELPFVLESVDFPGTNFIDIQHLDGQVIIRLNTRHRFYREVWEPLKDVTSSSPGTLSPDAAIKATRRALEALTLLLVAYGKAESMHETPREQYGDLRAYWGQFLDSMMSKVKNVMS